MKFAYNIPRLYLWKMKTLKFSDRGLRVLFNTLLYEKVERLKLLIQLLINNTVRSAVNLIECDFGKFKVR